MKRRERCKAVWEVLRSLSMDFLEGMLADTDGFCCAIFHLPINNSKPAKIPDTKKVTTHKPPKPGSLLAVEKNNMIFLVVARRFL